jgi:RNA polymerase sigma factor (sigma-70 family)
MKDFTDKELLQKFVADQANTTCFNELYRRYAHLLFGVALKSLKDEAAAQSVLNDTFLQIKKIETEIDNVGGWLYRVVRNKCIDKMRQGDNEPPFVELDDNIIESVKNDDNFLQKPVSERLIEDEGVQRILNAIQLLETEIRQCALLRFVEGYKYKEIAETIAISENEVKKNLQAARYFLHQKLNK